MPRFDLIGAFLDINTKWIDTTFSHDYHRRQQRDTNRTTTMDSSNDKEVNLASLIESCKPLKKRGRPSHKRQLREIRDERKINLQTAESVLTVINLKSILTLEALQSLPRHCQNHLVRLLPEFDQLQLQDGNMQASPTALSNEYFARFCAQFVEKLSDNKLSEKAVEQAKSDTSRELAKLDPWKLKNYEPIWGKKLISQQLDDDNDDKDDNHTNRRQRRQE